MSLNLKGRDSHWQGNGTQMTGLVPGLSTDGGKTGLWGLLTHQGSIHTLVPHQPGPSVFLGRTLQPPPSLPLPWLPASHQDQEPSAIKASTGCRFPGLLPGPRQLRPQQLKRNTPGTHLVPRATSPPGLFILPGPNLSIQPPGTGLLTPVRPSPPPVPPPPLPGEGSPPSLGLHLFTPLLCMVLPSAFSPLHWSCKAPSKPLSTRNLPLPTVHMGTTARPLASCCHCTA